MPRAVWGGLAELVKLFTMWYIYRAVTAARGHAMPEDDRLKGLQRSVRTFGRSVGRAAPAASAAYSLIGAILLCGGIGYGIDAWRGSAPWGVGIGLAIGL